ncbi:hypothetical protein [Nocardia wallacei]|uniref:hypothetical protein n=1 Tax=Nocardia wallacei TaxID=480035 RepID=UPI0024549DBD|nr:hypothetical protein [Nocardia wallacei]
MGPVTQPRKAIAVLRIEIRGGNDEVDMRELGERLGYEVDPILVAINPGSEGPLTTVLLALNRTKATAVIVPDLEHIDGIDSHIRRKAQIITVVGERILERSGLRATFDAAAGAA